MFSRRKQVDARGRDWDESVRAYETFIAIEQNWGVLIKFLKNLVALVRNYRDFGKQRWVSIP